MTDKEEFHFAATLTPNRSLSPTGFAMLMGFVSVVSFGAGIAFMLMGAWPIFGFFGLDVAFLYWAFKRNFADGKISETVQVSASEIVVCKQVPGKPQSCKRFLKNWVKVSLAEDTVREIIGSLTITAHGRSTEVAGFLSPDERKEFYLEFKKALKV